MKTTEKIWNWLKGKRTYICAGGYIAVNVAEAYGVIPPNVSTVVGNILLGLGGAALRAALKDAKKQ